MLKGEDIYINTF